MNFFNIENTFRTGRAREWDQIYVAVDVHETIMPGDYKIGSIGEPDFYPYAKETLKYLSARPDTTLILFTATHNKPVKEMLKMFGAEGIDFKYVNCNKDVESNALSAYDKKFYFNILLDDKAGFDGFNDWYEVMVAFEKEPFLKGKTR